MELRHLRYFFAVAETLNFTAAAKQLGIAQPPLSTQIKHLEREVGLLLFDRSSRKVCLTDGGRVFASEAAAILEKMNHLQLTMQDVVEGRGRGLRIAVAHHLGSNFRIARQLRKFIKKHRGVRCGIDFVRSPVESLQAGKADAIFVDQSEAGDFPHTPLGRESIYLAVSRKHRLSEKQQVRPVDLIGENLLLSPIPERTVAEFLILRGQGDLSGQMVSEIVSGGMLEKLWRVEAGLGVTVCSDSECEHTKVTVREFDGTVGRLVPVIAYRLDQGNPAVQLLTEHFTVTAE
jgi:DNA-binding transcriptional LysR family regulator